MFSGFGKKILPRFAEGVFDISLDKRVKRCDEELEQLYIQSVKRGYISRSFNDVDIVHDPGFGFVLSIVEQAVVFGYMDRHSSDSSDVAEGISQLIIDCKRINGFKEMFPDLKRPDHDWIEDAIADYYFNDGHGVLNTVGYAKCDPTIAFLEHSVGLPGMVQLLRLVRIDSDCVEFIRIGNDKRHNMRRCCDTLTYRQFLTDLYRITKRWQSQYHIDACDGFYATISCADIDCEISIANKYPSNYAAYMKMLAYYFG